MIKGQHTEKSEESRDGNVFYEGNINSCWLLLIALLSATLIVRTKEGWVVGEVC